MKKLLTLLIILVIAFAGLIIYLKQKGETVEFEQEPPLFLTDSEHSEEEEKLHETSRSDVLATLESLLPEIKDVEKLLSIPQVIDFLKDEEDIPDSVIEDLEVEDIDLEGVQGETYKEKLSFYLKKYKDEILAWMNAQ